MQTLTKTRLLIELEGSALIKNHILTIFLAVLIGGCATQSVPLVFSYFGEDTAKSQRGFVASYPHHACSGDVAIFSSTRIPGFEEVPGIFPDKIVEFSESGEILRRWAVPLESNIVAVANETVLFVYAPELAIAVGEHGDFDVTEMVYQASDQIECPESVEAEFPGSSYMRCLSFVESKESKPRLIALEAPCT